LRDKNKDLPHELGNVSGSNLSARGFFITGARNPSGSEWKYSMKLHGLQEGINDNVFKRKVVMHPYNGVEEKIYNSENTHHKTDVLSATEPMPLSWGCTMLPPKHASEIINKIKAASQNTGGSLYYNYSKTEKSYGKHYCGDEKLMIKK
jgi:hypothetical protein